MIFLKLEWTQGCVCNVQGSKNGMARGGESGWELVVWVLDIEMEPVPKLAVKDRVVWKRKQTKFLKVEKK